MARHSFYCPMRWADMDVFGHVNNTVYLAYLEQARIDVFWTKATGTGIDGLATGIVVAAHEITYKLPIVYSPQPLRIDLWVSRIKAASYTCDYEIWDESGAKPVLASVASSLLVPYDIKAARLRRLTPAEREFLEGCCDE